MNDQDPLIPARITDDEVARLPVHAGRADLLEDLMATPVVDRVDHRPTRPRRPVSAWLAVPAAAAAIAAIALVPVLRGGADGPTPDRQGPAGGNVPSASPSTPTTEASPAAEGVRSVPGGEYVALDAPGWTVEYVAEDGVTFAHDGQTLEIVSYPADAHASYYEDREHVSDPVPQELLGLASSTFTYSGDDHATIRPAEGDRFLEVRGSGMGLAAYRRLLGQLVQTDARGFADAVPPAIVTPYDKDEAIADLLRGVDVPDGFSAADVRLDGFHDRYQAAVAVAGAVGCAWLDVYAGGGAAGRQQALAALDGSGGWPLADDLASGMYGSVLRDTADQLRSGASTQDLRGGLC
ncbi:hypothetical protein H5V45_18050 [Nocardioides sp. KIGAM211]|uniref:Uncharacterized protein n=1 Tax=Nocardioides luti TaxID=2761101 RepID=A0A7X0VC90_9ACTN|nr:hypothetical protein [Nocardioides luti]MBB6629235.1 hypothetical protein [Nocardioides luti]